MTIGEKIKKYRVILGLTQTELGAKLGVQKNAVSKWECGRVTAIPTQKLSMLSELFHIPLSELIDDNDAIQKQNPSYIRSAVVDFLREIDLFVSPTYDPSVFGLEDLVDRPQQDLEWNVYDASLDEKFTLSEERVDASAALLVEVASSLFSPHDCTDYREIITCLPRISPDAQKMIAAQIKVILNG